MDHIVFSIYYDLITDIMKLSQSSRLHAHDT